MYQSIKVSAISLKPAKWEKASNADKLEAFCVEAAKDTPQLILATEGVLEGYVVMDVIEGKATPEAMLDIAEPIDGVYIHRFQPHPPSTEAARHSEQEYLQAQGPEMETRYQKTVDRLR